MRFGSTGEPLRWYNSQPAKCGPLTSQFWRLPSDFRMNAPFFVPTKTLTLLIALSYFVLCLVCLPGLPPPLYARFNSLMSSLTILSRACMTRCDFVASLLLISSTKTVGTICHERPNLSLSQPHCTSLPPAESFLQYRSSSVCVLQFTTNEIASLNSKCGPPFNAMNFCRSISNSTV